MSENAPIMLPDPKAFLAGKEAINPLEYPAEDLKRFAAAFEDEPLTPSAAAKLVEYGEVMQQPGWEAAHDAARAARASALKLVTENPTPELKSQALTVNGIIKSKAPDPQGVRGFAAHPPLQKTLEPLASYLDRFRTMVNRWAGLRPAHMRPKDQAMTPAMHRARDSVFYPRLSTSNPQEFKGTYAHAVDKILPGGTPLLENINFEKPLLVAQEPLGKLVAMIQKSDELAHDYAALLSAAMRGDITKLPGRLRVLASALPESAQAERNLALQAAMAFSDDTIQSAGRKLEANHRRIKSCMRATGEADRVALANGMKSFRLKREVEDAFHTVLGTITHEADLPEWLRDKAFLAKHAHSNRVHFSLDSRFLDDADVKEIFTKLKRQERQIINKAKPLASQLSVLPPVAPTSGGWAPIGLPAPHVHGPDCGLDHSHTHGSGYYEHGPAKFSLEEAIPKGNAAKWALGGLGVAAASAFFIHLLGKKNASESSREQEKAKDDEQKANDIAYTINHALSCGTTDVVLQPVIAATFGINVGCNHPGHTHGKQKLTWKSFAHEAAHYFKGEIIGDIAAVPLTIGVQRLFPDFMNGLRKILEPVFGWAFRLGANHTAKQWAKKQGIAPDTPEVKAHADMVYEHEISHLPQAAVWNMFAYPIGAFAQKAMGHGVAYGQIFKSKLVGAAVSNGILIGGRMIAPGAAQKWDEFTTDKLFLPVSKTVGRVFCVDQKAMEKAAKRQKEGTDGQWQGRLEELKQPTQRDL